MYDLALIASVFERDAAEIDRCPQPERKHQAAAIRQCCELLRTPNVSPTTALEAITVAAASYGGGK